MMQGLTSHSKELRRDMMVGPGSIPRDFKSGLGPGHLHSHKAPQGEVY